MRIPLSDVHKTYIEELLPGADREVESGPVFAEALLADRLRIVFHKIRRILLPLIAVIVAFVSSPQASPVARHSAITDPPAYALVLGPGIAGISPAPHPQWPLTAIEHPRAYSPRRPRMETGTKAHRRGPGRCPPDLGIATHTGKVRSRNEDAGASLDFEIVRIALLADGLGGEPFGDVASLCAIEAAMSALGGLDGDVVADDATAAEACLREAFAAAAAALAERGRELGIAPGNRGLRTTLLIAITSRDRVVFGQIGDGAMIVLREGEVLPLTQAQKANPDQLSLVAACLGPTTLGEPVFGVFERRPGDLLIAATDGVADRVTDAFYARTAVEQIAAHGGDLNEAAADLLERLAGYRHGGETVFDDNMTLALIADASFGRELASLPIAQEIR